MLSLNLDLNYFTNPKVERLTGILGAGSEIHHIRLMAYIGRCARKDGGLDDWPPNEVEAAAHWYGEKGLLVDALIKVKLMHPWKKGFKLHDWKQHAAHLISYDNLCELNRKKAKNGWEKRRKPRQQKGKSQDAGGMPSALPGDGNGNAKTKQNKTTLERKIFDFEPSHAAIHEASYSPECEAVFAYWVESKARVGLHTVTGQEKPDAARIAAHILGGSFSMDDYRKSVDNLMADEKSRANYGLGGVLRNINSLVNRSPAATQAPPPRHGMSISEIMRQQGVDDAG